MTAGLVDFRPSNVDSAGWVTFAETRYDVGLTFAVAVAESVELAEEEAVLEIHAAPCLADETCSEGAIARRPHWHVFLTRCRLCLPVHS